MSRPPLLTLSDITLGIGNAPLFAELSLVIGAGERLVLVGRNGSGKSTLMKVMAGLLEPDSGSRFLQPGRRIGYLEQDPDFSGFATLGDFTLARLGADQAWRVESAAKGLRLALERTPEQASGGERRRAALARILAEAPDLMLLDEPTNHLDIAAIEWLESRLGASRAGFVLVSHDRAFLRALGRGMLWIDRARLRRLDRGFAAFEDWRDKVHAEEDRDRHRLKRLIAAEGRWAVEGISARRRRNQGRLRRLAALRAEAAAAVGRSGSARMALESGPGSGRLVIEAEGLSRSFGDTPVIRDFSLRVMRGERIALVGANGAGKTTLLQLLTGRLAPDAGRLRLGSGVRMALFDQDRSALDPEASLWETLSGDAELGVSGRNDQVMVRGQPRHVVGYLKDFLFDESQARGPVSALSGGEQARLLLARLMARESNLLVLDEPTNDLDVETLDLLQELLGDFDGTVLLVSHDRDFIDRIATRTVLLEAGSRARIHAGGWSDISAPPVPAAGPAKASGPPARPPKPVRPAPRPPRSGLSYVEKHRLAELPELIEGLAGEIARLEGLLSDATLFQREPEKFARAGKALVARQRKLTALEEEWLALEERSGDA